MDGNFQGLRCRVRASCLPQAPPPPQPGARMAICASVSLGLAPLSTHAWTSTDVTPPPHGTRWSPREGRKGLPADIQAGEQIWAPRGLPLPRVPPQGPPATRSLAQGCLTAPQCGAKIGTQPAPRAPMRPEAL